MSVSAEILRGFLPDFKEKYILNFSYKDGEGEAVLAMLARKGDKLCLWEIGEISWEEQEKSKRSYRRPKTRRQEIKQGFGGRDGGLSIRELTVNGQRFEVHSAQGTGLDGECHVQERVLFLYMLQNGLRLGRLEQTPMDRLWLNYYELCETEKLCLDFAGKAPGLTVTLNDKHIWVESHKRLRLQPGVYEKPRRIRLYKEEEITLYIDGVSFYDIWEEAKTRFDDERYKERFSEAELADMKKQYLAMLPDICPKGSVLPIIEYENDKNYQMQFYEQEYLKKEPESKSSAVFLVMRSDKELGTMGYKSYVCMLPPVKKGCEGESAVELFGYYRKIAGKTVRCKALKKP